MTPTTATPATGPQTLPAATLTVLSTAAQPPVPAFPASGVLLVPTEQGLQTVTYAGVTATTFTGCTGGAGTVPVNALVSQRTTIRQRIWMEAATKPTVLAAVAHGAASIYGGENSDAVPPGAVQIDAPWLYLELDSEARIPGSNNAVQILTRWHGYDDVQAGCTRLRPLLQQLAYLYTPEWLGDGLIDSVSGEYWYFVDLPALGQETSDRERTQAQQWVTIPFNKVYSGGGP